MSALQSHDIIDFSNSTLDEKIDVVFELLDKQRDLAHFTCENANISSDISSDIFTVYSSDLQHELCCGIGEFSWKQTLFLCWLFIALFKKAWWIYWRKDRSWFFGCRIVKVFNDDIVVIFFVKKYFRSGVFFLLQRRLCWWCPIKDLCLRSVS